MFAITSKYPGKISIRFHEVKKKNEYIQKKQSGTKVTSHSVLKSQRPYVIFQYTRVHVYPKRCNVTQFILSGNCSAWFGWYHHPSSGAQTTVSTASGICHTVTRIFLRCTEP
jgi:hypothetical protein